MRGFQRDADVSGTPILSYFLLLDVSVTLATHKVGILANGRVY